MFEEVDTTIERVERLYRAVTGNQTPAEEPVYAPIPPERDPRAYVEEQVEKLLSRLGGLPQQPAPERQPAWVPAVSVWEAAEGVVICADLPGVTHDQISVEAVAGAIVISGHRQGAAPSSNGNGVRPVRVEAAAGAFRRVVPVPAGLGTSQVTARLKDGVIEIRVPRLGGSSEPRRSIAVQ